MLNCPQCFQQNISLVAAGEGLITYMRTDGVSLSSQAILQLREVLAEKFGAGAVPDQPR